jgi:transmembrane 9 superfamily member 2/4
MKEPKSCEIACIVSLNKASAESFTKAIDEDYRIHWIVDNLPVGIQGEDSFQRGFPVGFKVGEGDATKRYLNNHVRIIIQYHDNELAEGELEGSSKIVGFRVEPYSVRHATPPPVSGTKNKGGSKGQQLSTCANVEANSNYQVVGGFPSSLCGYLFTGSFSTS